MAGREGLDPISELIKSIAPRVRERGDTMGLAQFGRTSAVDIFKLSRDIVEALRERSAYQAQPFNEVPSNALSTLLEELVSRGYMGLPRHEPSRRDNLFAGVAWLPEWSPESRVFSQAEEDQLADILRKGMEATVVNTREAAVSAEWKALGERLGFLAAADLLAVADFGGPGSVGTSSNEDELVRHTETLAQQINDAEFPDFTLFVALTDPSPELSSRLFRAGAYDLPVPLEFWDMDAGGRVKTVLSLVRIPDNGDAFLDEAPTRPTPPPPSLNSYSGRNSALSPAQVMDWFDSHSRPAH